MLSLLLAASLAVQAASVVGPAPAQAAPLNLPPTPAQVWAIPDELRAALHKQVVAGSTSPELRLHRLVAFIFGTDGLNLQYKGDSSLTVAETYRLRQANCLSFTLLAVALAREAGLQADAQQINHIWTWGMAGNVVMQTMHANAVITIGPRRFVVDIATNRLASPTADHRIDDEHLLALYYGNRAMEFLAADQPQAAQTWLDTALRHEHRDATLWNNAGVMDRRLGNDTDAEKMFLRAVRMDANLVSSHSNLIALYRERGDTERASTWQQRADKILRKDPYYQYSQGQWQEHQGALDSAIQHYQSAIRLQRIEPLFHYALARVYFRMQRLDDAERQLAKAQHLSNGQNQVRFQAKLDALRRIRQQSRVQN